jgi:hypothetical protein
VWGQGLAFNHQKYLVWIPVPLTVDVTISLTSDLNLEDNSTCLSRLLWKLRGLVTGSTWHRAWHIINIQSVAAMELVTLAKESRNWWSEPKANLCSCPTNPPLPPSSPRAVQTTPVLQSVARANKQSQSAHGGDYPLLSHTAWVWIQDADLAAALTAGALVPCEDRGGGHTREYEPILLDLQKSSKVDSYRESSVSPAHLPSLLFKS